MLKFAFLFLIVLSLPTFGKVPRQKIKLLGQLNQSKEIELSISDFEKMPKQVKFEILDPYNNDKQTTFYNIAFEDIIKTYAKKETKTIIVKAIDGYKVEIKASDAIKIPLYLSYKDQDGYLSVDRMGPIRIIENKQGKIDKELLAKIGVNWVWQVKSIEFK